MEEAAASYTNGIDTSKEDITIGHPESLKNQMQWRIRVRCAVENGVCWGAWVPQSVTLIK